MTGFIGLGTVGRIANSQGAGALPWDVNTGLLAFEDMSQSQLQSGLTALGFTQTRTGTALRTQTGTSTGSWYEVGANELGFMPGSTSRYGLFVGSAVTNRCLHSNDLTQWGTPVDASVVYTASGGFAGNGYSTVTFTGANGYVPQVVTDTSAERIAGLWCERVSGSDAIEISQDGGSTYASVDFSAGGIVLRRTAAQALANPEIRIRGQSGNVVRVYNVNAQRGTVLEDPIITGASTVTRNAESCVKTLAEAPSEVTLSMRIDLQELSNRYHFQLGSNTTSDFIEVYQISAPSRLAVRARNDGGTIYSDVSATISESEYSLIETDGDGSAISVDINGALVASIASSDWIQVGTPTFALGARINTSNHFDKPIYRITGIPA